jgi:hypothetical protein
MQVGVGWIPIALHCATLYCVVQSHPYSLCIEIYCTVHTVLLALDVLSTVLYFVYCPGSGMLQVQVGAACFLHACAWHVPLSCTRPGYMPAHCAHNGIDGTWHTAGYQCLMQNMRALSRSAAA